MKKRDKRRTIACYFSKLHGCCKPMQQPPRAIPDTPASKLAKVCVAQLFIFNQFRVWVESLTIFNSSWHDILNSPSSIAVRCLRPWPTLPRHRPTRRLQWHQHQHVKVVVRYHSPTVGLVMSVLHRNWVTSANILATMATSAWEGMFARQFSSTMRPASQTVSAH